VNKMYIRNIDNEIRCEHLLKIKCHSTTLRCSFKKNHEGKHKTTKTILYW
jgi:hypothetical protein